MLPVILYDTIRRRSYEKENVELFGCSGSAGPGPYRLRRRTEVRGCACGFRERAGRRRRDPDGNVVPGLAETWEVSDDGMSITFHLQEGVKFQDGSGLTAEDVAFSLNRAIDKPQSELYTSFMDSAEAVDGSTVKVNLKYKELAALQYLTQTNSAIVSKAYVESVGMRTMRQSHAGPARISWWSGRRAARSFLNPTRITTGARRPSSTLSCVS